MKKSILAYVLNNVAYKNLIMSKKPYIIKAPKRLDLRLLEIVEMDFIISIVSQDLQKLNIMLSDTSTFMGKYNKWQVLNIFQKLFEKWTPNTTPDRIVEFYAGTGRECGQKAIMIDDGNFPGTKVAGKSKVIILESFEGKITDIRFTSEYTDIETFENLSKNN